MVVKTEYRPCAALNRLGENCSGLLDYAESPVDSRWKQLWAVHSIFFFSWLSDATFPFLLVKPLALWLILSLGSASGRRCPEILDEEGSGVPGELGPAIAVEGLPVGPGAVLLGI